MRKGFTIIELLAVLIILSIVVGISVVTISISLDNAKEKTEEVFIKNMKSAIEAYLENRVVAGETAITFSTTKYCTIAKRTYNVSAYKNTSTVKFSDIINGSMSSFDFVNPVNKDVTCNDQATINIFKDEDQVYYYSFNLSNLSCMKYRTSGTISTLPC